MNILIPMAGAGSRFEVKGFNKPKPLVKVCGKPMVQLSIESLGIKGDYIFVTRLYDDPDWNKELDNILTRLSPNCKIIPIDYLTEGAAQTCLLAKEFIDNGEELIITNCDQYLNWNPAGFLKSARSGPDGCVATYNSSSAKNSFIKLNEDGLGIELAEKKKISETALVGIHYWAKGFDFISSAEEAISNELRHNNEYFIAPTYNHLISKGKKITSFPFKKNQYHSLGSPEDLKTFLTKQEEFKNKSTKTIICDIDGTLFNHCHGFSRITPDSQKPLDGVLDKMDQWDCANHKVILMTARKESARSLTESQLKKAGIAWDHLIMDAGGNARILINDKLNDESPDRALSVNLETDEGFNNYNWENIGL